MPIHVQAPNGELVEFPDGTSDDVMSSAMRKAYGQPTKAAASAPNNQPAVDDAAADRDKFYTTGIYSGSMNPLGPIAKSIDAFSSAAQRAPLMGFDDEAAAGLRTLGGNAGDYEAARQQQEAMKQAQQQQNPIGSTAGSVAGMAAGAGPLGEASLMGRAVQAGAPRAAAYIGGVADAGALGALQGAGDAQPGQRLQGAEDGFVGGAAVGAALPVIGRALGSTIRGAVSPFLSTPEREAAAQYLAGEGVNLTAGQRTGSNMLRYAESEIGGQAARNAYDQQGEQFTRAALSRAGISADRATPEVMSDGLDQIGAQFDGLAARNRLMPDIHLATDLAHTSVGYQRLVNPSQRSPAVQAYLDDITGAIGNNGHLDGDAYQAIRSRLDKDARSVGNSDPHLQQALLGIRNSLDDGMERSIASNNPSDLGGWRDARRQYRNFLVLEKASTGAGEDAASGLISPAQLRGATVQKQGVRNYATGDGDFADLARAGSATMQTMPQSGTAPRSAIRNAFSGLPAIVGAGAGYGTAGGIGVPLGALAGNVAPALAKAAVGRAMMSGPVQSYLGNQVAQGAQMSPRAAQLVRMILLGGTDQEDPQIGAGIMGIAGYGR